MNCGDRLFSLSGGYLGDIHPLFWVVVIWVMVTAHSVRWQLSPILLGGYLGGGFHLFCMVVIWVVVTAHSVRWLVRW